MAETQQPRQSALGRRRFEHLVVELSVAVGRVVPRYALWMQLSELGAPAERLEADQIEEFFAQHLTDFLAAHDLDLSPRARRRLERSVRRFDPRFPSPYETMERLVGSPQR